MFINEIHRFIGFLKNQGQNKYHSPEEIDDAINRASLDLFRQEEKVFEQVQVITDTLRPFKKRIELSGSSPYDLPEDYRRAANVSHNYTRSKVIDPDEESVFCDDELNTDPNSNDSVSIEKEIDIVPDGDWVKRLDNLIVGPTENSPIARIYGDKLEVSPNTVTPILYYLREPVKAKWGYTISQDGRTPIFDQSSSVDIEWTQSSHNEIIEKALGFLGIAVRDQTLIQFEQLQKNNNNE